MTAVCKITILFIFFFVFVFESNKSTSCIIYYLKIIQYVVLGHPPPCTQISQWDLMNELLSVIGCCCPPPPPRHPFLLPSDKRGNTSLPPLYDGFLYSPAVATMKYGSRSGGDEIRLPHTIMPLAIYHFTSLSHSLSLALSIYLYISIHFSLFPRGRSYTHVYMILSLTPHIHRPHRSVCVCHVFFTYTLAPRRRS